MQARFLIAEQRYGIVDENQKKFLKLVKSNGVLIQFNPDPECQKLIGKLLSMRFKVMIPNLLIIF